MDNAVKPKDAKTLKKRSLRDCQIMQARRHVVDC